MPRKIPKYVIVWDFDQVINIADPMILENPEAGIPAQNRKNYFTLKKNAPYQIPKILFKLILDILHENNILSVLGSQRISYNSKDPYEGPLKKNMDNLLDKTLGADRPYLTKEHADIISSIDPKIKHGPKKQINGNNKNPLLDGVHNINADTDPDWDCSLPLLSNDRIMLVDDVKAYGETAQAAGYQFYHFAKVNEENIVNHMANILLRVLPIHAIKKSIEQQKRKGVEKTTAEQLLDECEKIDQIPSQEAISVLNKIKEFIDKQLSRLSETPRVDQKGVRDKIALYKHLKNDIITILSTHNNLSFSYKNIKNLINRLATISHHRTNRTANKFAEFVSLGFAETAATSWIEYEEFVKSIMHPLKTRSVREMLGHSLLIDKEKIPCTVEGKIIHGYEQYRETIINKARTELLGKKVVITSPDLDKTPSSASPTLIEA